jgi:CBS domain-containing protein
MGGSGGQTRHVRHPILHLDLVGEGGVRLGEARVFCKLQRRAVAVDTCRSCRHCDAITDGPDASVDCTVPDAPDDAGREPEDVGAILSHGAVVLEPETTVGTTLAWMHEEDRRSLAVVGPRGVVVGVIHEAAFIRRDASSPEPARDQPVFHVMSSPLAIHERTPVRDALRLLAAAHLREAAVVDADGVPLGVFRDVDGLRHLAMRARRRSGDC